MKLNKNYVLKHILETDVLIDIKSNENTVIKLNDTSKDIIEAILDGLKYEEIINRLNDKYEVDINELKKDIDEFIQLMINKGIIIDE